MIFSSLVVVCLAALSPAYPSFAQRAKPETQVLAEAQQLFTDGRLGEALAALRTARPSAARARLTAQIAVADDRVSDAIDAYEELTGRFSTKAPDVLAAIAAARARSLRMDSDPLVRVAACDALLAAASNAQCVAELKRVAGDLTADAPTRLAAARAIHDHRVPSADQLLESVVNGVLGSSPAVAADALARLPPRLSDEPLKRLAAGEDADARYIAVLALGRRRSPDLAPIFRYVATDVRAGAARLAAYIGLAAIGDAEGLRVIRETRPLVKGRERLEIALALTAIKDPAGPPLLQSLLNDQQELLRIDAAEAIYSIQASIATPIILNGAESPNPWIRIRALEAIVLTRIPTTAPMRRMIVDSNPLVAVAACRAALEEVRRAK